MDLQDIELKQNRRGVFAIFTLLSLIAVAIAVYYYFYTRSELISHGAVEARVMAEQKSGQLTGWLEERCAEGTYLAKNPMIANAITATGFAFKGDNVQTLEEVFDDLRVNHDYSTIALLSNSGETILFAGDMVPASTGKKAAEVMVKADSQFVIYDDLTSADPALTIITPVPIDWKPFTGFIYQKIPLKQNLLHLLKYSDKQMADKTIRVFYFTGGTLYSLLDSLPPQKELKLSDPPTIPETIYRLAKAGRSGVVYGTGFDAAERIGYFQDLGSGLFLYFAVTEVAVVEPLLPIGVLLTIIILITLAASALGIMLILSRQQATYAGRLAESEAFLESLREGMSDGFILFSDDMRYLAVNSKAALMIGKPKEEIIGSRPSQIFTRIEDSGFWKSFNEVRSTGQPVTSVDYYPEWDIYYQNKIFVVKQGIAIFFSDITDEIRLKQQIEAANEQLEALTLHLQEATENEREAIAREIHDELGQVLTSLKMDLAIMRSLLGNGLSEETRAKLLEEIAAMGKRIDATVKRLRRIITELRPEVLDHLGFVAAVEWLVEESASRSGVKFTLNKNIESIHLEKNHATALFRIIQEACTNIIRHSEAKNAEVLLDLDETRFKISITDDGKGFVTDNSRKISSFGLIGMKERAKLVKAELKITSTPGVGTKIELEVRKK